MDLWPRQKADRQLLKKQISKNDEQLNLSKI